MIIDENTKLVARLHPKLDRKGLNIYNPYFESANVNAVYLLFQNPNIRPLLEGLRNLNASGAIPAGFEKDPLLIKLMDELDPIAKKVGKVGVIRQRNGKLTGYYQAGYGLTQSIMSLTHLENQKVVIMGAGQVVKGFLAHLENINLHPNSIEIYNRTIKRAQNLAKEFKFIKNVGSLSDLLSQKGDIFVNASYVGSKSNQGENFVFPEKFISAFKYIVDVSFVPLKSQLIEAAQKLKIPSSPGWKMFVHQGSYCLNKMLDIDVNTKLLEKFAWKDFSRNWPQTL